MCFFCIIVAGGCANRMRGGWRPFGEMDSVANDWLHKLGRMSMAAPTGCFVLLLSGQPALALMITLCCLIGSEPGWGCYYGMGRIGSNCAHYKSRHCLQILHYNCLK